MKPSRRAILAVAVCVTLAIGSSKVAMAATTPSITLDQLMQALAAIRSGRAAFVEERRVVPIDQGQLATPPQVLRSSGELSFEAPGRFERHTSKPRDERLQVDGNTLTMSRGGRSRTLQLDTVPEAQAMVEAVRGTLTGDGRVLLRYFDAKVDGTLADWRLELVPKDARLRGTVKSISLRGRQSVLREVALQLADGDSSSMTIEPLATPESPASEPAASAAKR